MSKYLSLSEHLSLHSYSKYSLLEAGLFYILVILKIMAHRMVDDLLFSSLCLSETSNCFHYELYNLYNGTNLKHTKSWQSLFK